MFEYDKAAEAAASTLDAYDFTSILISCYDKRERDPWDIKKAIINKHPELKDVLDELSTYDEFMDYLCKKYHVRFEEIIHYSLWYNPHYR